MRFPEVSSDALELLNTEEMIEVDRLMTDVLKIELMQMMENAGRNLARLCVGRFLHDPQNKHVLVMAGTGGNGGGALVAARRLHQWGANVSVFTTKPDEAYSGVPAHQLGILRRLGVEINHSVLPEAKSEASPKIILDGLIGYSLKGYPRGRTDDLDECIEFTCVGFGYAFGIGFNHRRVSRTNDCRECDNDARPAQGRTVNRWGSTFCRGALSFGHRCSRLGLSKNRT